MGIKVKRRARLVSTADIQKELDKVHKIAVWLFVYSAMVTSLLIIGVIRSLA